MNKWTSFDMTERTKAYKDFGRLYFGVYMPEMPSYGMISMTPLS